MISWIVPSPPQPIIDPAPSWTASEASFFASPCPLVFFIFTSNPLISNILWILIAAFNDSPFPEIGFDIIVIFCLFMKFED